MCKYANVKSVSVTTGTFYDYWNGLIFVAHKFPKSHHILPAFILPKRFKASFPERKLSISQSMLENVPVFNGCRQLRSGPLPLPSNPDPVESMGRSHPATPHPIWIR